MEFSENTLIGAADDLRQVYRAPSPGALRKCLPYLDEHARQFIALSPLVILATSDGSSSSDASPRGGAPGHVAVLDDQHLLLPDRSGNNRLDSFHNILRFPYVGLLFFIPGLAETLRVNGCASIVTCPTLLARCNDSGKAKAGLLVEVSEMYLHCSKAVELSALWQPGTWPDTRPLASPGRIWSDHIRRGGGR
jgi:PPOX class probable FMN-dependent enzyme